MLLSLRAQFVLLIVGLLAIPPRSRAQDAQAPQPQGAEAPPESMPLNLSEFPPGPVIVNYQQGQLMIEAQNSTLSIVLRAACSQTGTAIDIPSNADERVVGVFGPGSARDIFASLLNGSRFNYVMLGSTDDATKVMRLTLSVRSVPSLDTRSGPPAPQSVHPAPQAVAKVAEAPAVPQIPQQAEKPLAEPNAQDHTALKEIRRRHRR
jgi:hypothetical protein